MKKEIEKAIELIPLEKSSPIWHKYYTGTKALSCDRLQRIKHIRIIANIGLLKTQTLREDEKKEKSQKTKNCNSNKKE